MTGLGLRLEHADLEPTQGSLYVVYSDAFDARCRGYLVLH